MSTPHSRSWWETGGGGRDGSGTLSLGTKLPPRTLRVLLRMWTLTGAPKVPFVTLFPYRPSPQARPQSWDLSRAPGGRTKRRQREEQSA